MRTIECPVCGGDGISWEPEIDRLGEGPIRCESCGEHMMLVLREPEDGDWLMAYWDMRPLLPRERARYDLL
jgi:DNA-directed RNA polymerase subunit RPC12/RpoP